MFISTILLIREILRSKKRVHINENEHDDRGKTEMKNRLSKISLTFISFMWVVIPRTITLIYLVFNFNDQNIYIYIVLNFILQFFIIFDFFSLIERNKPFLDEFKAIFRRNSSL